MNSIKDLPGHSRLWEWLREWDARMLVHANRELIARMEQKIQATLGRVWGDH